MTVDAGEVHPAGGAGEAPPVSHSLESMTTQLRLLWCWNIIPHEFIQELDDWVNADDGSDTSKKNDAKTRILDAYKTCCSPFHLNLSNLSLKTIPPLSLLTSLQLLNLSDNQIGTVAKCLVQCIF